MVRWLAERSVDAVRDAVARICPDLAGLPVVLHDEWVDTGNPLWARSSAFVGDAWVVKFAWSEPAADKLEFEIDVLRALATSAHAPPLRRVHASSSDPVLLVSPFVPGAQVQGATIALYSNEEKQRLARALGGVLASFHQVDMLRAVSGANVTLPPPTPQATTAQLRDEFCPMLDERRRNLVVGWCDWTDGVLAVDTERVVLHGDFHGYNLIIDERQAVRAVLDLEEAACGDFHYDLRYLPAQEKSLELFLATAAEYGQITHRSIDVSRVMAWHIRTVLGDALWRTAAGIALPGNGTIETWIDEIAERVEQLDIGPARLLQSPVAATTERHSTSDIVR